MDNGCFSRKKLGGWHIVGLPDNPRAQLHSISDISNGIWSSKKLADGWLQKYGNSYCIEGTYYPSTNYSHTQIIDYIKTNYGESTIDGFKPHIIQIKNSKEYSKYRIEAIEYSSANTGNSEIEVFQITEVIKSKEQVYR